VVALVAFVTQDLRKAFTHRLFKLFGLGQTSEELRNLSFEVQLPAGTTEGVLDAYALYFVCEGVDGVCIISHGSSSERAIVNAIDVAREMVEADVVGEITTAILAPVDEAFDGLVADGD